MSGGHRAHSLRALTAVTVALMTLLSGCGMASVTSSPANPSEPPPTYASESPTATPEPEPVRPRPKSDPGPLGSTGKWKLAFSDEFSGDSLDLDKWRPNWLTDSDTKISKPINRGEHACYDPANVSVAKGSLRLKAEKRSCTDHTGRSYDYATGAVESAHDYTFTYGFAEARMYLKPSDGTLAPKGSCGPNWTVFLLNGHRHPEDGEIDVMECLSDNDVAWHYHYGTNADPQQGKGYPDGWRGTMPGTSGWHTFGVNWERGKLTFYFDGVVVGTQTEGVTNSPHYLVLTQAISGQEAQTPQTVKVDWVRVWKPKEK